MKMFGLRLGKKNFGECYKKLLGIEIGRNLNFDDFVSSLCKKAGRKLAVLARLFKFMSLKQERMVVKRFFETQFRYCPLIWVFHSRKVNRQKLYLRNVWDDYMSSF